MSHDVTFITDSLSAPEQKPKIPKIGKILAGITGGVALGLSIVCIPFVSPAFRRFCLPYIPATNQQVNNVLNALKGRKGTLLDLGAGDGRIVFESAAHGFISHGIELNPWLVLYSKCDALRRGLFKKTRFHHGDLWKFDISTYDNIVIFGVEQMMPALENKLVAECKNDCNIVACRFPLPNNEPVKTVGSGIDTVWVYVIPEQKKT